jgi:hypothetical protein
VQSAPAWIARGVGAATGRGPARWPPECVENEGDGVRLTHGPNGADQAQIVWRNLVASNGMAGLRAIGAARAPALIARSRFGRAQPGVLAVGLPDTFPNIE